MATVRCPTCDILITPTPAQQCPRCNGRLRRIESQSAADPPSLHEQLAREMAQRDSTRGMIIVRLKKTGLDDTQAAAIADRVLSATKTQHRGKGLIHVIIGIAIAAVGILVLAAFAMTDEPPTRGMARIVVGALLVGAIETLHGVVRMVTGTAS